MSVVGVRNLRSHRALGVPFSTGVHRSDPTVTPLLGDFYEGWVRAGSEPSTSGERDGRGPVWCLPFAPEDPWKGTSRVAGWKRKAPRTP